MDKYVIKGPVRLNGSVRVSGSKNAAVAIIPACILIDGVCILDNIPDISDVRKYLEIMEEMGVTIERLSEHKIKIDARSLKSKVAMSEKVRSFRASYYLVGSLLSKYHYAKAAMPGGCKIGKRPIDMHLNSFEMLGADVTSIDGHIEAKAEELKGTEIVMNKISVGATINTILAATLAKGTTKIVNVAKEPHVIDVCNFLNKAGANISGMGTNEITIQGVEKLEGDISYSIVSDQIEASTFIIAAVASGGDVKVENIVTNDQKTLVEALEKMGAKLEIGDDYIRVIENDKRLKSCDIETSPHPGFPTDIQSQFAVLLAIAEGKGSITEKIWEGRFTYVKELNKMGAKGKVDGVVACFEGVEKLHSANVESSDLRGGAALIIAGNIAEGTTEVRGIEHIDRGYENLAEKFKLLGSDIEREKIDD